MVNDGVEVNMWISFTVVRIEAFEDYGLSNRIDLLRKLVTMKLEAYSSVEDYVNQIVSTAHKLTNVGLNVTDEWVGYILLAGLSDTYKQ
jgi:hypothetical protein